MLIVTSIVLWLLGLIPVVGPIIGIIAVLLGLGIITYSLVIKNNDSKENAESKKELV